MLEVSGEVYNEQNPVNIGIYLQVLYKWIKSLKKRRVDFWVSHNFYKEEKTYEEVYDSWQDWKEKNLEQKNFFYKPYEEWNKNWKMYLNEIQKITKWKRKHSEFVGVYRRF